MPRHVLVTGGAGYVGSHACKALAEAGYVPVALDNLVRGHRWAVQWGPFVQGDLAQADALHQVLRKYRIEAVLHFAAYAYVGESMQAPGKYFRNNVANTLNLLDAMGTAGIRCLVFSSTCATYGLPDTLPITEEHPQRPVNPYGESKLFVERALHWYGMAHGLRSVSLRYFNAAGADLQAEIGEHHDPETHLIPLAIQAALGSGRCLNVCGTDYPTPDGTAIRDYIHVTDLARAHVQALAYLLADGGSTAVNLGTGVGHSVLQVVGAVERVSGRIVVKRNVARRAGDPPVLVADAARAHRVLDWRPRHSALETIVESAWCWHTAALSGAGSQKAALEQAGSDHG